MLHIVFQHTEESNDKSIITEKMDWTGIAGIIGAIGVIILGIIESRRSRKDKMLEHKFAMQDKELERRFAEEDNRKREHQRKTDYTISNLYSYLYALMNSIDSDRVSIVQPHPSDDQQYISLSYEVVKQGISPQIDYFQSHKIQEWTEVIDLWRKNEFLTFQFESDFYLQNEIDMARKIWTEANRRGCLSIAFYRLIDANDYWIGTLTVDYMHGQPPIDAKYYNEVKKYGDLIADILPEYVPIFKIST